MAEHGTILASVANWLKEDGASEALCHILNQYPGTLRTFESLLLEGGADVGHLHSAKTQVGQKTQTRSVTDPNLQQNSSGEEFLLSGDETEITYQTRTIPDISVFDRQDNERVLIEVKFLAHLQDSQPNAYLSRLYNNPFLADKGSAVLFVVPSHRRRSVWRELLRRVRSVDEEVEIDPKSVRIRSAALNGRRYLMAISWSVLVNEMLKGAVEAGEIKAECDLWQLLGLIDLLSQGTMPLE